MKTLCQPAYSLFILAVLISSGIILQILGLPFTFSNTDSSSDLFESSVLEGFTMIAVAPILSPWISSTLMDHASALTYWLSFLQLVFRPPVFIV